MCMGRELGGVDADARRVGAADSSVGLERYVGAASRGEDSADSSPIATASTPAALVGGSRPGKVLEMGARRFRTLPLDAIAEADLLTNEDTGLHAKTAPAELGRPPLLRVCDRPHRRALETPLPSPRAAPH